MLSLPGEIFCHFWQKTHKSKHFLKLIKPSILNVISKPKSCYSAFCLTSNTTLSKELDLSLSIFDHKMRDKMGGKTYFLKG